ncbi:MAG: hypothetical protein KAQ94_06635 [Arcobacteraceae bacterium]|nr:hypothetical protein [Arcobacteraceae bacterium]
MIELFIFIIIFAGLEVFESNWQKADTFYGVIKNNYIVYQKSLLLYFFLNPTFIYTLFLSFYLNNFTFWMSSIIVLKFADISFRLHLMQKIDKDEPLSDIIPIDMSMNNYLRYINVVIYPLCFIFANLG